MKPAKQSGVNPALLTRIMKMASGRKMFYVLYVSTVIIFSSLLGLNPQFQEDLLDLFPLSDDVPGDHLS